MECDLLYVLQMSKRSTFQELATNAHEMEMTIANHHGKLSFSYKFKDKRETKKSSKPSKALTKGYQGHFHWEICMDFRETWIRRKEMTILKGWWKKATCIKGALR